MYGAILKGLFASVSTTKFGIPCAQNTSNQLGQKSWRARRIRPDAGDVAATLKAWRVTWPPCVRSSGLGRSPPGLLLWSTYDSTGRDVFFRLPAATSLPNQPFFIPIVGKVVTISLVFRAERQNICEMIVYSANAWKI